MRYCVDTWFILSLFNQDEKSEQILRETKEGKVRLIISVVVFAESTKKLLQKGISQSIIDSFWDGVESSEKMQLVMLDKSVAKEAAKVSLSYNVPLIDSLVAATCKIYGCNALLSGDGDYRVLVKNKYLKMISW